jgi:hypothetical protein
MGGCCSSDEKHGPASRDPPSRRYVTAASIDDDLEELLLGDDDMLEKLAQEKLLGSSRELDKRTSDNDFDSSSNSPRDIADIRIGAWCLVKRSDGSWKYGMLFERKENTIEIIVNDQENTKLFSTHQYDGNGQDSEVRALDVARAGASDDNEFEKLLQGDAENDLEELLAEDEVEEAAAKAIRKMERKVKKLEEEARKQTQQAQIQAAKKAEEEVAKLRVQIEQSARLEAERAEEQTRLQMEEIKAQAMREAEEEVAEVRSRAKAESLVRQQQQQQQQQQQRTATRLKKLSATAAGVASKAAVCAYVAGVYAATQAQAQADSIVCEFDPEEGFALNDAARAFCVSRWESESEHLVEGDGDGSISSHRAAIRVDYRVLEKVGVSVSGLQRWV